MQGEEAQILRNNWSNGMDYQPFNPNFHYLTDWLKVIYSGDYQQFLEMIDGKSDEIVQMMLMKRETLLNINAIFH